MQTFLIHFLHDHPKHFTFKQKYQQNGSCLQTIFPFLMTMIQEDISGCWKLLAMRKYFKRRRILSNTKKDIMTKSKKSEKRKPSTKNSTKKQKK